MFSSQSTIASCVRVVNTDNEYDNLHEDLNYGE